MSTNRRWNPAAADPMAVMRICGSYWEAFALQTAITLNIFTKISEKGTTSLAELAEACGVEDPRGLEMLLMACVGLGFLTRQGDIFSNTEQASTFLIEGGPRYQGGIAKMFDGGVGPWSGVTVLGAK